MQDEHTAGTPVPANAGAPADSAPMQEQQPQLAEFEIHASALIFPPMREAEFEALVEDIRANGQKEPIVTHQGKIIDGRHRHLACKKLGILPITGEWDGQGSLLDFIVSANLRRRHLKENQRAMVAARLMPHYEEEAQKRRQAGGVVDSNQVVNLHPGKALNLAGKMLSISGKSVSYARILLKKELPELVARVDLGALAVSTAAKIVELPPDEQQRLLKLNRRDLAAHFRPAKPAKPVAPAKRELTEAEVRRDEAFIKALPGGQANLKRCDGGLRLKVTKADWYNELAQLFRNPYFPDLLDRGVLVIRSDDRGVTANDEQRTVNPRGWPPRG